MVVVVRYSILYANLLTLAISYCFYMVYCSGGEFLLVFAINKEVFYFYFSKKVAI